MTRKRDILSHLTRDELLSAVDTLGLEVADRRAKDPAIEVLAASKRASLSSILGDFKRDRLKELGVRRPLVQVGGGQVGLSLRQSDRVAFED